MKKSFKFGSILLLTALAITSIIFLSDRPQREKHSYSLMEEFENPNVLQQLEKGKTFYTDERKYAFPLNGSSADRNPPTLLWPIPSKNKPGTERTSHRVFIASSPNFEDDQIIASPPLKWGIFRPQDPLPPGTYHWKFETTYKGSTSHSPTQTFKIADNTPADTLPSSSEMVKRLPSHRPRLLVSSMSPSTLRNTYKDNPIAQSFVAAADQLLNEEGQLIAPIPKAPKGSIPKDWKEKKLTRDAVKNHGRITSYATSQLLQAYLLTNEEQYAQHAIALAMKAAERTHAEDITLQFTNNFGNGGMILTMALTLDTCYDLLSKEQKQKLTAAITMRIDSFFEREWVNKLETLVQRGHPWQGLLSNVLYGAIAVHGEEPKSELWIRYIYEIWNARFPALGGEDGTWAVGPNYLSHNFETMIRVPAIFQSTCGINLFEHPFFTAVSRYCAALPWMPGFNDAYSEYSRRVFNVRDYIEALDIVQPSPWTQWYIQHAEDRKTLNLPRLYRDLLDWNTLVLLKKSEKPMSVDSSPLEVNNYLFSSSGLAVFHSNRLDLSNNIMLSFKSNPWGPTGHSQREQNTFNIQKNGEPVFFRTGYRITAGDPHNQLYYGDTVSKNGILIDSRGQAESAEGTGHITHFFHDDEISYVAGQAKNAYNAESDPQLTKLELETFGRERTGSLDVKDFKRHVIFLKPHYVVIYDSLKASTPRDWQLMLHAHKEIQLPNNTLSLEGNNFSATASVFTHNTCEMNVNSTMTPAPENWRKIKSKDGKLLTYKPHWHFAATTKSASESMKFLTVISVAPKGHPEVITTEQDSDTIQLGQWKISANLKPESDAAFEISSATSEKKLTLQADGELTIEHANQKKTIEQVDIKKIGRGNL